MSRYRVEFSASAARDVRKLEPQVRARILAQVRALEENPRPQGCRKLVGEQSAWRIRVGDYRVLYEVLDRVVTVTVFRVAHGGEAYR